MDRYMDKKNERMRDG